MSLADWMAPYGDRKLSDMILPGSHDAGTAKGHIDKTLGGTNSNAATQNLTIPEQLEIGTRFFDLRLSVNEGTVVAKHTTFGQGAYSKHNVSHVLRAAANFCESHKSEVLIFRISHTSASTNIQDIIKYSCIGQLCTTTGNLADKTLDEIRRDGGGVVCILDEKKFKDHIDQKQGIHSYTKYGSLGNNPKGLCICGCYSMTHKLHKVVTNGLRGQYEHCQHHTEKEQHLWQVYWQKTYVNPVSTTGIERGATKAMHYDSKDKKVHGGTHASTQYMLGLMRGLGTEGEEDYVVQKEEKPGLFAKKKVPREEVMYSTLDFRQLQLPNIFSYDFVNEDINKRIIKLNEKGLQAHDVN